MRSIRLLAPVLCGLALAGCRKEATPEGVITARQAKSVRVAWSLPADTSASRAIAFSSDGTRLAIARGGSIELRNARGALVGRLPCEGRDEVRAEIGTVAISSANGRWIVAFDRGCLLSTSDMALAETHRLAPCTEGKTTVFALAPNGRALALVAGTSGTLVFGRLGEKQTNRMEIPLRGTETVAWSPDGRWLVAAGSSGRIAFIDARRHQQVDVLSPHYGGIRALAWSPASDDFASATDTGPIVVWNVRASRFFQLERSRVSARALAWSPDGKLLAAAGDGRELRIWDVRGRREVALLRMRAPAVALAWSPDGRALASYEQKGALEVWRLARER